MKSKIFIVGNENDVQFINPTCNTDPDFNVPEELQKEFTELIGEYIFESQLLYSQESDFAMPEWAKENAHIINAFDHMVIKYGVDFARKYSFSYGSGTNSYDVGLCLNDGFCHWRKFNFLLPNAVLPNEDLHKKLFSLTPEQKKIFNELCSLLKKAEDCELFIFEDRETNKLHGMNQKNISAWFDEHDKKHYPNPINITPFLEEVPSSSSFGGFLEICDLGAIYAQLK